MNASLGFLTAFGGMTSHAALVGRQMGKVCIVGCDALSFDYHARAMTRRDRQGQGRRQGRRLDLDRRLHRRGHPRPRRDDADRGHPRAHREEPRPQGGAGLPDLRQADDLGRRAPASCACAPTPTSPTRPTASVAFGAEGIGLCRTEHMFFGEDKIGPMREMIVAENEADRAQGARQAAAAPARGLRRHLPRDDRPAGHDPDARSAAARVPAARRGRRARAGEGDRQDRRGDPRAASRSSTSRTRCSATAAAASASSTRRSPRCRRAPSSRRPCDLAAEGEQGLSPRS